MGIERLARESLPGFPCGWFAPQYKFLTPVWREMLEILAPAIKHSDQQERRIELLGGGSIEMWTLDSSDAGRGRAYKCIVVDEAAMVADLENAWQQSLRPTLADYRGSAWFLSTPKGTANYFHTLCQRGQSEPDWASWQMPTSTNPYIDAAEIEAARSDLTDLAFAQEYLAQFVVWAGSVFRRLQDAVRPITPTNAAIIGCDWGRTNDYTVFTAINSGGDVVAIDRFRGMEYSLQRARLRAFWERLGKTAWIIAEANSMGGPVVEQLQADGLPVRAFTTTAATKAQIIEGLALAFERDQIKIPNDPVLLGELQAYECKPSPSGVTRYSAPEGLHDDCVMSLAIAWAGLGELARRTVWLDPRTGNFNDRPREYQISPI